MDAVRWCVIEKLTPNFRNTIFEKNKPGAANIQMLGFKYVDKEN
jgi:hypothetical protein